MNSRRQFAVVTGASRGIGFELARQFAEHGFDLLIGAEDEGIQTAAERLRAYGVDAQAMRVDLATGDGVDRFFGAIRNQNRPVDALALNAGVGVGGDFTRENSLAEEMNLIALNVTSVVHLAKHVLPGMVARGSGRVLITSSIAALMPGPFYATYAASKSFLLSFAEALGNELRDSGVTVTALMPGPTDTDFFVRAHMLDTPAGQAAKDDPAAVAKEGFDALMAGHDHVIAGSVVNRLNGFASKFLSEKQKASLHRRFTEPAH